MARLCPGRRARRYALAAVTLAVAACGRGAPPGPSAPDGDCVLRTGAGSGAVTIGLVGEVDPSRAPIAATEAERLLFPQLYEPLVGRDCAGRLRPALAAAWRTTDGGRRWHVTLRRDARFWTGRAVKAEDVLASWGRHGAPGVAVAAADDTTVAVTFSEPLDEPWPLADPAFSVAAPAESGDWPLGTTRAGRVRHVAADDARDLLDAGADVVVTRLPAVVTYARGLGGYDEAPLPWDRAYVLLNGDALLPEARDLTAGFVAAVDAFARAPREPFWWTDLEACGYLAPRSWGAPTRVAYPPDDVVARDLAARVAAVSVARGVRARPVAPGDDAGALVRSMPRSPFRPCAVARAAGLTASTPGVRPLVETRAVLLVRRATAPGVLLAWDGLPLINAMTR